MAAAIGLADSGAHAIRAGIWKPRTRPGCFEGVGALGLTWLKNAGNAVGLPVTTEVAKPDHVEACLKAGIDMVWIGARTTANPFAVQDLADALAGVDIPVFIKNPVNPDIELWIGAFERLSRAGIQHLNAIHRGFSSYKKSIYRNDPKWRIPIELKRRHPEIPILCDPSHICGNRELLQETSQKAMDLLFDGLMIECHPAPQDALSDSRQQIVPDRLKPLLTSLSAKRELSDKGEYRHILNQKREQVKELDERIITLLSARMGHAREIGRLKKSIDVSILQPSHWKKTLDRCVEEGMKQGLTEHFIIRLFQYVHEESIRHQEIGSTDLSEYEE